MIQTALGVVFSSRKHIAVTDSARRDDLVAGIEHRDLAIRVVLVAFGDGAGGGGDFGHASQAVVVVIVTHGAFLQRQEFIEAAAVDVLRLQDARGGVVRDHFVVVIDKIRCCPVHRLTYPAVERIIVVAGGGSCLRETSQAVLGIVGVGVRPIAREIAVGIRGKINPTHTRVLIQIVRRIIHAASRLAVPDPVIGVTITLRARHTRQLIDAVIGVVESLRGIHS